MERIIGKGLFLLITPVLFLFLMGSFYFLMTQNPAALGTQGGPGTDHRAIRFTGKIVFVSSTGKADRLMEIDPNTLATQPLLSADTAAGFPAVSPKGDRLAYITTQGESSVVYMKAIPSGQPVQVSKPGFNLMPTFSADGEKLIYVVENRGARESGRELWEADLDGGKPSLFVKGKHWYSDPTVLPDGQIICSAFMGISDQIVLVDPKTGGELNLTDNRYDNKKPAVSPDGKKIAFYSNRLGNPDIYTMKSDGTEVHRLTLVNRVDNMDPSWSPDGKYIVFASNRSGDNFDLYVMDEKGEIVKRLTDSPGNKLSPRWYSPKAR